MSISKRPTLGNGPFEQHPGLGVVAELRMCPCEVVECGNLHFLIFRPSGKLTTSLEQRHPIRQVTGSTCQKTGHVGRSTPRARVTKSIGERECFAGDLPCRHRVPRSMGVGRQIGEYLDQQHVRPILVECRLEVAVGGRPITAPVIEATQLVLDPREIRGFDQRRSCFELASCPPIIAGQHREIAQRLAYRLRLGMSQRQSG